MKKRNKKRQDDRLVYTPVIRFTFSKVFDESMALGPRYEGIEFGAFGAEKKMS